MVYDIRYAVYIVYGIRWAVSGLRYAVYGIYGIYIRYTSTVVDADTSTLQRLAKTAFMRKTSPGSFLHGGEGGNVW